MGFRKKTVNNVVLLVVLIASSVSVPIIDKDLIIGETIFESREEKMARYRLPNNSIPRLYNIYIEPNMDYENFTWIGKTSIDIEVIDPTSLLTLHAHKNLLIDEKFTGLVDTNGTKFIPVKYNRDEVVEFLTLQFSHKIPVGNYSLNLKYAGTQTYKDGGFFRTSYTFGHLVAGTFFEATKARHAFPCWDEPDLKARFRVSIKHFPNYTAISNMPEIEHVEIADGKILTTFDTTPIMSTYLLTFVISDYKSVFNKHRNVSLHAPESVLVKVNYLQDLTSKIVQVMETYTGFSYGLPRIGSVLMPMYALPAVEHWGLVTYREKDVSFNAALDSITEKDNADMVVAHELAHSWFGNRVTPFWWSDIWINEAFAGYFQYYILDKIYKNWGSIDLFVLDNNQEVSFHIDTNDKMPVKWTPISNEEIELVFQEITYRKGPAIVHMFRNVLGDKVFRAGIQKFMTKHSFKAATIDDLMSAFQEAYDMDANKQDPLNVMETLNPWLVQKGYPIVNVTRNYTTGSTEMCQKSTLIGDSSNKWWIPLTYATKSSLNFSSTLPVNWISDKENCVIIDEVDKDDWIILNVQASGYFRVNYDNENWDRIADYLNTDNYTNVHPLNRAQLISDAFFLTRSEPDRYFKNFYKLTKYLSRETNYLPWRSAHFAITRIESSLRNSDVHKIFVKNFLKLMSNFIRKIGFEVRDTDDHFMRLARTDVIQWACMSGHLGCSEWAAEKMLKLVKNPVKYRLHPDTRSWTFCAGMRVLNDTAIKQFADWAYKHDKSTFLKSVACTENHEIHRNILNTSLTQYVAGNSFELFNVFERLTTSNKGNFNVAIDFFIENLQAWNSTVFRIPVAVIVKYISRVVGSRAELEKFKQVLLLDAVREDKKISKTLIMQAEQNVAKRDAAAALFLNSWDKQLSSDNTISSSKSDAH